MQSINTIRLLTGYWFLWCWVRMAWKFTGRRFAGRSSRICWNFASISIIRWISIVRLSILSASIGTIVVSVWGALVRPWRWKLVRWSYCSPKSNLNSSNLRLEVCHQTKDERTLVTTHRQDPIDPAFSCLYTNATGSILLDVQRIYMWTELELW